MRKTILVLVAATVIVGAVYFWLKNDASKTELEKFRNLCESTDGYFMGCDVAFAAACSTPTVIDGVGVACSCRGETRWDAERGCVKK